MHYCNGICAAALLTHHGEEIGGVCGPLVRVVLHRDVSVERVGGRASEYPGEHVQGHRTTHVRNLRWGEGRAM